VLYKLLPCPHFRLFSQEVNEARKLNIRLGVGIGMFQGLANIALNGMCFGLYIAVVYSLTNTKIIPGI